MGFREIIESERVELLKIWLFLLIIISYYCWRK